MGEGDEGGGRTTRKWERKRETKRLLYGGWRMLWQWDRCTVFGWAFMCSAVVSFLGRPDHLLLLLFQLRLGSRAKSVTDIVQNSSSRLCEWGLLFVFVSSPSRARACVFVCFGFAGQVYTCIPSSRPSSSLKKRLRGTLITYTTLSELSSTREGWKRDGETDRSSTQTTISVHHAPAHEVLPAFIIIFFLSYPNFTSFLLYLAELTTFFLFFLGPRSFVIVVSFSLWCLEWIFSLYLVQRAPPNSISLTGCPHSLTLSRFLKFFSNILFFFS